MWFFIIPFVVWAITLLRFGLFSFPKGLGFLGKVLLGLARILPLLTILAVPINSLEFLGITIIVLGVCSFGVWIMYLPDLRYLSETAPPETLEEPAKCNGFCQIGMCPTPMRDPCDLPKDHSGRCCCAHCSDRLSQMP